MAENLKPLINRDEYYALDDETKAKYRIYVPESDKEVQAQIALANAEIKAASYLKPLHDKIMAMPVDLPGKQFKQAVETFAVLITLVDPIKSLLNVPIIGQLVAPLVNFINALISIIGSIFYLLCCIIMMKDIFTDSYVKAIDDIKWDELKDAKEAIKLRKKAVDKAVEEKKKEEAKKTEEQKKAEEDKRKKQLAQEKEKVEKAIKKEVNKDIDEMKKQIEKMYDNVQVAEAYAQIMKAMKISLQQYSWKEGTVKDVTKKVLETVGIDITPLEQMTPEQEKAFSKNFPDPKDQVDAMNKVIRKMNANTKYALIDSTIPIEEAIKQQIAEDEAKAKAKVEAAIAAGTSSVTVASSDKKATSVKKDVRTQKLSEHFYLYEFTYSRDHGDIPNIPSESQIENLRLLCENILEPLFEVYGKPTITSGYRSPELNSAVGGVRNSEHTEGKAVDFVYPGIANRTITSWIAQHCTYRQLLEEKSGSSSWIHISFNSSDNKCENLSINDKKVEKILLKQNKTLI